VEWTTLLFVVSLQLTYEGTVIECVSMYTHSGYGRHSRIVLVYGLYGGPVIGLQLDLTGLLACGLVQGVLWA
jgi:hypothetical protein